MIGSPSYSAITPKQRSLIVFLAAASMVVFSRIPAIATNYELNVDESMQMVLAKRMAVDWVPWRSADPTTSGPLNAGFLAIFEKLGLHLTYSGVHLIAAVLFIGNLALSWLSCRKLLGQAFAAVALLAVSFWCMAWIDSDYIHYSSELVPVFLIGVGLNLIIDAKTICTLNRARLLAGGFALGLAPWAKLQSAPIVAAIFLWIAYMIYRGAAEAPERRRNRAIDLSAVIAAGALPSILFLAVCYFYHSFDLFWISYVQVNLHYAGDLSLWAIVERAGMLLCNAKIIGPVALSLFCLTLQMKLSAKWRPTPPALLLIATLASSLFAILRPQTQFPHYQIFLLIPYQLLIGLGLKSVWEALPSVAPAMRIRFLAAVLGSVSIYPVIECIAGRSQRLNPLTNFSLLIHNVLAPKVADLSTIIAPGDSLYIWGWCPSLCIDLQARPTTRFSYNAFQVNPNPQIEPLRKYLMADLVREKPQWIVATRWYPLGGKVITPFFAELQSFVDQSYERVALNSDFQVYKRVK